MRWPTRCCLALLSLCPILAAAEKIIQSTSLVSCARDSTEAATLSVSQFQVVFTPANHSLFVNIQAISAISSNITADIFATAYGYPVYQKKLSGCDLGLDGLCPLTSGNIPITTNIVNLDPKTLASIPSIAFSVPDLDGQVTVRILNAGTAEELACFQASLSNGQTVYHKGVGWASAAIAGLALLVSAVVAGLGHNTAAAHIAADALSLFGFFQHQAIFGMTAIPLPPMVAAWTQNFQWSMGIINVGFVQDIATWYQRSTGGTPSSVFTEAATSLVKVQKRSILRSADRAAKYLTRYGLDAPSTLQARQQASTGNVVTTNTTVIRGIDRVGYNAGIELTNIFMTGYIFFIVFIMLVLLLVLAFKAYLEFSNRPGASKLKTGRFQEFRTGWTVILKGILFRIALIAFPQIVILCFWELAIAKDSAAEMTLAAITVVSSILSLGFACVKILRLAKRSIHIHGNPAYILYSDPAVLHKWGFLYVQYRAACCWFTAPWLAFMLVLGLFVATAQSATGGTVQAVAILIIEALILVTISILRPWMDKKTNALNISIAAINFTSSIWLLFFSNVFGVPALVTGIMGVVFFAINAIFALVLLIMLLVSAGFAVFSKNPDVRYQPMQDDRSSFIKSSGNLTTELDALAAIARGDGKYAGSLRSNEGAGEYESLREGAATGELTEKRPLIHQTSRTQGYDIERISHDRGQSLVRRKPAETTTQYMGGHQAAPWQRGAGFE